MFTSDIQGERARLTPGKTEEFVVTESLPRALYSKVVKLDLATAHAQSRKQSSRSRGA